MHALVVEGGGMKGVFANGVLSAFEEREITPWGALVGTSAGGALVAWYAARQARFAEGTWRYAEDPAVLSYRRFLTRRGPLLDHDFLLDSVYAKQHAMDLAALRRFPVPVVVVASSLATGEAAYHDVREGDALLWLKATGRLPLASGRPVDVGGLFYLDGGLTDPIPVRYAVEVLGASRVTLVLNQPHGHLVRENPFLAKLAASRYPTLRDGILHHQLIRRRSLAYALRPPLGVQVDLIEPSAPTGVHRLTRDAGRLSLALEMGRDAGRRWASPQTGSPAPTATRDHN
ncbi:MAG: patatin-like phospholipase family protein [Thermoplasmatota archaeon]